MTDVREIIAKTLHEVRFMSYGDDKRADAILAALEENGMVVVDIKPPLEAVWVQNLCGFIDGSFTPIDDKWREIWKRQIRALVSTAARPAGTVKEG